MRVIVRDLDVKKKLPYTTQEKPSESVILNHKESIIEKAQSTYYNLNKNYIQEELQCNIFSPLCIILCFSLRYVSPFIT